MGTGQGIWQGPGLRYPNTPRYTPRYTPRSRRREEESEVSAEGRNRRCRKVAKVHKTRGWPFDCFATGSTCILG